MDIQARTAAAEIGIPEQTDAAGCRRHSEFGGGKAWDRKSLLRNDR